MKFMKYRLNRITNIGFSDIGYSQNGITAAVNAVDGKQGKLLSIKVIIIYNKVLIYKISIYQSDKND